MGKGKRHWSSSAVYSSVENPYPLDIAVKEVSPISFVWDEYCDKFGMSEQKVGSYDHSSVAGPPAGVSKAASSATPQATVAAPPDTTTPPAKGGGGGRGRGQGSKGS